MVCLALATAPWAPGLARAAAAPAAAELGPLVSGTLSRVGATTVWTDYAYDDTGASYPDARRNAADLIQLQLSRVPGGVRVRAILETLLDPSVPRLTIGFDTDGKASTGAATLPGFDWTPAAPLGLDVTVQLAAGTAGSSVDVARNVVEAVVPHDPGGATWRAYAAVGLVGQPDVFDLAFVGGEGPSGWQDGRQNAVLTGDLAPSAAAAAIDFGARGDRSADIRRSGFHTLLYRSAVRLGEGIGTVVVRGPTGEPIPLGDRYDGPYQPYLVWVPPDLPRRPPLVVHLHGFQGTHTSNAGGMGAGKFAPRAVVAMPLGRGGNSFYMASGEQDVLDVTDDALRRYGADPDRVTLGGTSMGGFGTFRIAVRYPDRWSGGLSLIGTGASAQSTFEQVPEAVRDSVFSPSHFLGGTGELVINIANLPFRMVNGQADPIVNNALVTFDVNRLDALGYDYRYWVLERRHHEVVPALASCVMDEIVSRRRANPARVVFRVVPSTFYVDPAAGLSLVYDRAYWVSGLVVRDADAAGATGTIDVTSLARADRATTARPLSGVGQNLTAGADLCGPNPAVQTDDVWRMQGTALSAGPRQPVSNGLQLRLDGLDAATLDLSRAGVRTDRAVTVDVTGDGPATLRLVGAWPAWVRVELDGVLVGKTRPTGGAVAVSADLAGQHRYRLSPLTTDGGSERDRSGPRPRAGERGTLPATGAAGAVPALALGVVAIALLGRRLRAR